MIKQLFCSLIAGLAVARGQQIENPELDFVTYALSEERSEFEGFWGGEDTDVLPGGTLARINYDVTGDGQPDRLLAHGMTLRQGHGMQLSWVIYVKANDGYRSLKNRLEDRLEFNESVGFYIDRNHIPPIITTDTYDPDRGSTFSAVVFDGAGFRKISELFISNSLPTPDPFSDPGGFFRAELKKRGFDPGPKVMPKMEIIALGEYLHNPNAKWHDYGDTETLEAHFKQISPALASFTIEEADRLLEGLKPALETPKLPEPARANSTEDVQPSREPENPKASAKQISPETSKSAPFFVWALLALAAAAGGLFWCVRGKGTQS